MTKKRKIILVAVLMVIILAALLAKPVIHMVIELFEPGQESLNDLFQLKKGEVALVVDDELQKVKDMGFNMLPKHAKIDMRRWYYHCDRLGILVMQDMVSGGFIDQDKMTTM